MHYLPLFRKHFIVPVLYHWFVVIRKAEYTSNHLLAAILKDILVSLFSHAAYRITSQGLLLAFKH